MFRSILVTIPLFAVAMATPAMGQQHPQNVNRGGTRIPAVGTMLPDVKAFDEQGNAFSTSSLRGSYSVLVFGCLT